jgi:beta-lactam-binding protein with PASTA domain
MAKINFKEILNSIKSFFKTVFDKIRHFDIKKVIAAIRNFDVQKCRVSFINGMEKLQANGKAMVYTILAAFLVMMLVCLAVFFASVRSPEKVMVPDVVGKDLTTALLEMQVKELYPRIQLRYTNDPDDQGKILNQSPDAGAIVKAGRRITLTVSRGVVIDHVEKYIGEKIDDVRIKLQSLFTGSARSLIVLADPVYKADQSEAGTILEQDPPEGTKISEPIKLQLIVSRGPEFERAKVPDLVGMNVNDVLMVMSHTKIVFDFTSHIAQSGEKAGTVTMQQSFDNEYIDNYSRMTADFAFPAKHDQNSVYGIFADQLTEYPYPVKMTLDVIPPEGERYTIVTLTHTGGSITIPYVLPEGTELILVVAGKDVKKQVVQ